MNEEPYYNVNGLSPLQAMNDGLISKDEYRGFLIGSALKYLCRFQYKEDAVRDLQKCRNYVDLLIRMELHKNWED